MTQHLLDNGLATETELAAVDEKALNAVAVATKFANDSPFPNPEELTTDVYVSYR